MLPQNIGEGLLDIFEGVDMEQFVSCQKNLLLDYIAQNAKKGLPFDLEEYMQLMLMLYGFLEDLPTKKHFSKEKREKESRSKRPALPAKSSAE